MKIAIAATIWIDIPPKKYGGTEAVIHNLANSLSDKGHSVTVFAPQTTKVSAKIYPTLEKPLLNMGIGFDDYSSINYHLYHYLEVFRNAADFDLIHIHLNKNHDYISLPLAMHSRTPVLFTLHFPAPTSIYRPEKYLILNKFRYMPYTSISDAARSGNDWNFIKTVYNSINIKQFPYSSASGDYFAWIGKALPIKGLREAIKIAKMANVKLKIMAAIDNDNLVSKDYFDSIKPEIDGKQIEYLGEADLELKTRVLGKAKAFLNPIQWPEPFGLVMAESLAVGTPVIVLNKGAAPELVVNGKTGYVVNSLEEMVGKVKEIERIQRIDCRKHVEDLFTPSRMVAGYEEAYLTAIKGWDEFRAKQQEALGITS